MPEESYNDNAPSSGKRISMTVYITAISTIAAITGASATVYGVLHKTPQATVTPTAPSPTRSASPAAQGPISFLATENSTTWYLGPDGGNTAPGTRVEPQKEASGSTGQQWYFFPDSSSNSGNSYYIASQPAGQAGLDGVMVLTYSPSSQDVTLEPLSQGDPEQQWTAQGNMLHSDGNNGQCLNHYVDTTQFVGLNPSCQFGWTLPGNL